LRRAARPAAIVLALSLAACNQQGQALTDGLPADGYRSAYPIAVTEAPRRWTFRSAPARADFRRTSGP
jgi:hypothetical protein